MARGKISFATGNGSPISFRIGEHSCSGERREPAVLEDVDNLVFLDLVGPGGDAAAALHSVEVLQGMALLVAVGAVDTCSASLTTDSTISAE